VLAEGRLTVDEQLCQIQLRIDIMILRTDQSSSALETEFMEACLRCCPGKEAIYRKADFSGDWRRSVAKALKERRKRPDATVFLTARPGSGKRTDFINDRFIFWISA